MTRFLNYSEFLIVGDPNFVFVSVDKLCRFARGRILPILSHVIYENLLVLDPTIIYKHNFIDLCYERWVGKPSVLSKTVKLILHKHEEILDHHAVMIFFPTKLPLKDHFLLFT